MEGGARSCVVGARNAFWETRQNFTDKDNLINQGAMSGLVFVAGPLHVVQTAEQRTGETIDAATIPTAS